MSKAFTSEETPDAPPLVPRRAPLPEGTPNYVTPSGLRALKDELQHLESERARVLGSELELAERSRELAVVQERISELEQRVAGAQLVEPDPLCEQVRFGALVTVVDDDDESRRYAIVGVDEADAARGLIAFTAPLARALLGKRVGDAVKFRTPRQEQELTVSAIAYERPEAGSAQSR